MRKFIQIKALWLFFIFIFVLGFSKGLFANENGGPLVAEYNYTTECLLVIFTNTSDNSIGQEWTFGTGDTLYFESPIYTFPAPGIYPVTLSVINEAGTEVSVTKEVEVDYCTGIFNSNTTELKPLVSVYPNPVSEFMEVNLKAGSYNNNSNAAGTDITIFSMTGEQVYKKSFSGESHLINVVDWSKGLYLLNVNSNSTSMKDTVPFVVQ